MRAVHDMVARVADSPSTVLITGESGTGKELVAKALHRGSLAARQAAHQGELRRHPQGPGGERAVRLRARRLHRRGRLEAGPLRAGRRRHPLPRRDRRDAGGDAGEAPPRPPGVGVRARRRHQDPPGRRPPRRRHQPGPQGAHRRRAASARTSTTGWRWSPSPSRRCATGARTSRCSSSHFIEKYDQRLGKRVEGIERRARWSCSWTTAGPGNIRELENLMERSVLFADGAAHPGRRPPRGAARARRPHAQPRGRRRPPRRHRRPERRLDEGDRPPGPGRAGEGRSSPGRWRRPAATSPGRPRGCRSAASRCR